MPSQRAGFAAWGTALLLLLAPGPASALIPTGDFEFALFLNQSIWLDVTEGEDEFCEGFIAGFGGTLQACEFSMFLDAKGKITGGAEIAAVNGDLSVSLDGPVKGKLKGDGQTGFTEFSFSLKLAGELSNGVMATDVTASVTFNGQIDGEGELTGDWSTKFCSKATGCFSEVETPAPETLEGGGWMLVLSIVDLGGGKLGGNAVAELGDGTQCPYAISGKYSAKSDLASLKLSPSNAACAGTSISLKEVQRTTVLTGQMKYKLFGHQGDTFVSSILR